VALSSDYLPFMFNGKLERADNFETNIGRGLLFRLRPFPHEDDAWDVDVCDSQGNCGFVEVANPPFRFGAKVFEIRGWHLRNEGNPGPNDGSTNAPGESREIRFVTNIDDFKIAKRAFDCGQNSSGSPCEDFDKAVADLNALKAKMGTIRLALKDFELAHLKKGERAEFQRLGFSAKIDWPIRSAPVAVQNENDPYQKVWFEQEGYLGGMQRFFYDVNSDGFSDLFLGINSRRGNGGGPIEIYLKSATGYKYIGGINAHPLAIEVLKSKSNGVNDLKTYWHMSASDGILSVYSYDGIQYRKKSSEEVVTKDDYKEFKINITPTRFKLEQSGKQLEWKP
jgi:hypothetical protein